MENKKYFLPRGMAFDHKCRTCGGTGYNKCPRCQGDGKLNGNETCYYCQGKGLVDCPACKGTGVCPD